MSGTTSGVNITQSNDDINLQIYRGKTLNFSVIWGGETPIDITGFDAALMAVSHEGDVILDLTVANGGIVIGDANGQITIKASAELTANFTKIGKYELELTNVSGDVFRVISGTIAPIEEFAN